MDKREINVCARGAFEYYNISREKKKNLLMRLLDNLTRGGCGGGEG
jgi:hypothetical protein